MRITPSLQEIAAKKQMKHEVMEIIIEGHASNGVSFTLTKKHGKPPRVSVDPMEEGDLQNEALLEIYTAIINGSL